MKRLIAVVASLAVIMPSAASASPNPNCFPIPHAEEIVNLVEPQNAAIFDPRGIWIEFSVVPFDNDIRGLFILGATAAPLGGGSKGERLVVDPPYRLSGDTLGTMTMPNPRAALWIAHISKPDAPSRVTVTYSIDLWRTPSGERCDGPLSTRRLGDFIWVPTNGVGPFGQKPPLP